MADIACRIAGAGPDGETGLVDASPAIWGDVILARKETPTSYHLAVAVDDLRQGGDPRLPLELALVKVTRPGTDLSGRPAGATFAKSLDVETSGPIQMSKDGLDWINTGGDLRQTGLARWKQRLRPGQQSPIYQAVIR